LSVFCILPPIPNRAVRPEGGYNSGEEGRAQIAVTFFGLKALSNREES
jgi:hypothetical protein